MSQQSRTVDRVVAGRQQNEGVGVKARFPTQTDCDFSCVPNLACTQPVVDPPAGFSDHPHRGFMTLSYLLDGEMHHEDFAGNKGRLKAGDAQWMIAGKGIVHAEVPKAPQTRGIQLWINIPATHKSVEPQYSSRYGSELPVVEPANGVTIKLIAGSVFGATADCIAPTPLVILDVTMRLGVEVAIPIPCQYNVMVYSIAGQVEAGEAGHVVSEHAVCLLNRDPSSSDKGGDASSIVRLKTGSDAARLLFIAEPMVHHGPFVLGSYEDIRQALDDYHECTSGFERARGFRSKISKAVRKP